MTKTFKDIQGIEEACWVGYKKVGMKKKGDRMVPNCVKEEVVDNLLGKDYVYESVADMYKGQFTKAQLAKMKQTWATKKASDVDQRTKDFVKNLDQFSQMDIKNANIKYISALIEEVEKEEFELVSDFNNIVEENEMRVLVRRNKDLKEYFSASQLDRLAKAYSVMKDRTISVSNAQKLGKMVDGIPDHALNDLRKKKIPFISGLALSRMIKRKIPVTESTYEDKEEKQIVEADLSKSQIKKVHKQADDLPKKDFMKRYGKDGDAVRYATATNMVKKKLGLGEDNKFIKKGELKMNESYKKRLTSAMEHYKISSLGELKDEDQKTFFNYVDGLEEGLSAGQKKLPPALQKAILAKQGKKEVKEEDAYDKDDEKPKSKPKKEDLVGGQKKLDKDKDGDLDAKDFAMLRKTKSEAVMTKETDSEPKMKDLNAMVKDPHKSMTDKPMKDMNAMYMKSNVKAPVMNNGGADMAAVKDKPTMGDPMKKINATYGMTEVNKVAETYANMAASKNKMNKETHAKYLKTKPGSLEEAVLIARGLIEKKSLNEAKYQLGMREFNFFKGNDLMKAMNQTKKDGNSEKALDDLQMYGGDEEDRITFTANNPSEAARNAEKAILTFRNKNLKNDRNALSVMKYLELEQVDGKTPTTQQKSSLKRVLDKFDIEVQFNTPNGKGPSNLEKFVKDESLDDMVVDGVM